MSIKHFFIAFTLIFSALTANAQQNAIRIQPLHLFLGKQSIQYERMYNAQNSFTVELQRWSMGKETNSSFIFLSGTNTQTEMKIKGYSVEIMNRFYFQNGFKGLYLEGGPHFSRYSFYKKETKTTKTLGLDEWWIIDLLLPETNVEVVESWDDNNTILGAKGGLGYHMVVNHLSLDFGAGARLQSIDGKQLSGDPIKPFSLYARAGIGIAF